MYFYPGGQDIGKFIILFIEEEFGKLESRLDFRMSGRIDILVYNDITDLSQTNLGIETDIFNTGGTTRILGNKIFVHFDGNHNNLYRDVREAISSLLIDAMMFGGSLQEILQNAVLLNLPEWFKPGLAAFVGSEWNTGIDNDLRYYILSDPDHDFVHLSKINPRLAGHSLWHYVSEMYGKDKIQNVLYLTRINRSAESGFVYELGIGVEQLVEDWKEYFRNRYADDIKGKNIPDPLSSVKLKVRKKRYLGEVRISPEGRKFAYAAHDGGFFKLRIMDIETGKSKKILKGGFRSDSYPHDQSYPVIAWNPAGTKLGVIHEKRDVLQFLEYDLETGEKFKDQIRNFQRVYSFEYVTPVQLVLSAQTRGQTDIFTYLIPTTKTVQYTNDFYDDLDPVVMEGDSGKKIIWSSNRYLDTLITEKLDSVLPLGTFDLFAMDLERNSQEIARLTGTPFANERKPRSEGNFYYYLSDETGVYNIYRGFMDSIYVKTDTFYMVEGLEMKNLNSLERDSLLPDTFFTRPNYRDIGINIAVTNHFLNILEWDAAPRVGKQVKLMARSGRNNVFLEPLDNEMAVSTSATRYRLLWERKGARVEKKEEVRILPSGEKFDTIYTGDFDFYFQSEYDHVLTAEERPLPQPVSGSPDRLPNTVKSIDRSFRSSKIIPYRARFTSDFVVTQLDNSVMIHAYDNFNLNGPVFNFPDLSGLITYGLSDLMEDHRIIAGFRIPVDFNGSEVFVSYNNLKKRFDKRLLFYRKTDEVIQPLSEVFNQTIINGPVAALTRIKTHYAEGSISYPFDVIRSLRLHVGYRNDRSIFLPEGELVQVIGGPFIVPGLFTEDFVENWVSGKLEYIHDDSKEIAVNIPLGLKFKTYFEYFRNFNQSKANLYNFGWDVRHYQRVFKTIIWANRFAGASSWGDRKIVYYLGGVDTWLNSKFETGIPVSLEEGYAFQANATNLRGQRANVRNGNSFILWNSEIRVPIFQVLSKRVLKSNFLRNFQIVGFLDAGAAYKGITPFDEENPFTEETIGNPPVTVDVNFYRNPLVAGYGVGMRTTLLGYFFRMDVGWGLDGSRAKEKPLWYFSLSKDF